MKKSEKTDPTLQKAFGKHIRKLRVEKGWKQIDLAAVSRINEAHVSNLETGVAGPTLHTIKRLAFALGIHPAELFKFEYDFKFNKTYIKKRKSRPATTSIVNQLVKDEFFKKPKTVGEVIKFVDTRLGEKLESADTSGAILRLVRKKILKRSNVDKTGKASYQNP